MFHSSLVLHRDKRQKTMPASGKNYFVLHYSTVFIQNQTLFHIWHVIYLFIYSFIYLSHMSFHPSHMSIYSSIDPYHLAGMLYSKVIGEKKKNCCFCYDDVIVSIHLTLTSVTFLAFIHFLSLFKHIINFIHLIMSYLLFIY